MNRILTIAAAAALLSASFWASASTFYVTVAGLGGEPDYEQRFTAAANDLDKLFKSSPGARVYTLTGNGATRTSVTQILETIARESKPTDDLVLTLIGHGTFDGTVYRFNLVGPDLSGAELAALCDRIPAKRQLIVNTSSASGGSVAALERPGRAVIAATKTGTEKNATVFSRYWVEALQDPTADLDKSASISAMEAFTYANRKTSAFYESQKRLATEHAVFEDTGHGDPVRTSAGAEGRAGTLLANLTVLRLSGSTQAARSDPARQALLAKKEDLEQRIDALKFGKAAMDPADYKKQLTDILLELAATQGELDR